jgi:hypothetical protein
MAPDSVLRVLNFLLSSGCLLDESFEAPTEAPTDGELMTLAAAAAHPAAPAMCDGGNR